MIREEGPVYHVSSVSASYIISVKEDWGGVALRGSLVRGGGGRPSCSCQHTERNSSGGGEGQCEERQPALVCDVSAAAINSPGENHRGELRG